MSASSRMVWLALALAVVPCGAQAQYRAAAATAMHATAPQAVASDSLARRASARTFLVRGAAIGATTGVVLGFVAGSMLDDFVACPLNAGGPSRCNPSSVRLAASIAGGVVGAVVGTATGGLIALARRR